MLFEGGRIAPAFLKSGGKGFPPYVFVINEPHLVGRQSLADVIHQFSGKGFPPYWIASSASPSRNDGVMSSRA
jgi:hypothetical protein